MTRKKAIEIIIETAKNCSWVPKGWKYAAAAEPGARNGATGARGVGFWVTPSRGDPTYGNDCEKSHHNDKGWYFSRKWLEEKGYL